jgi:hypothetical protein
MHKVNTIYKRVELHSQRITSISIHHLTIIQRLHPSYMMLEQVAEMKPAYQKQKGHKNLILTPQVTFEITSYQATC